MYIRVRLGKRNGILCFQGTQTTRTRPASRDEDSSYTYFLLLLLLLLIMACTSTMGFITYDVRRTYNLRPGTPLPPSASSPSQPKPKRSRFLDAMGHGAPFQVCPTSLAKGCWASRATRTSAGHPPPSPPPPQGALKRRQSPATSDVSWVPSVVVRKRGGTCGYFLQPATLAQIQQWAGK